jgi:hypothetical protein
MNEIKVNLEPFIDDNTNILFIPLNPSEDSNEKEHYFACNNIFWSSLKKSKLINVKEYFRVQTTMKNGEPKFLIKIDNSYADLAIFKNTGRTYNNIIFGIRDLFPEVVCSNSSEVRVKRNHITDMLKIIENLKPNIALLMHGKVRDKLLFHHNLIGIKFNSEEYFRWESQREEYKRITPRMQNFGAMGKVFDKISTFFYSIPFPCDRNGTPEQNAKYWELFKNFIDDHYDELFPNK